ncbi:MAG: bacteriocin immunity protein [Pseudomonas farsensis]|uniref:bacteriocin immunity protein n=1 Tax=Pseudomonas farsensis TaxID=2745492 RepID=UPI003C7A0724
MKELSDYTEQEFLDFVSGIYHSDQHLYPTERAHIKAALLFEKLVAHPLGLSLIFHTRKYGMQDSPEGVVNVVKQWRAEQGLPGFKEG